MSSSSSHIRLTSSPVSGLILDKKDNIYIKKDAKEVDVKFMDVSKTF